MKTFKEIRKPKTKKKITAKQSKELDAAIKQLGAKGTRGKDMEKAIAAILKDMGIE